MNALKTLAGAALALSMAIGGAQAQVLFWSTQARPVEETQKMRSEVLKSFDGQVDYQVAEDGPWLTRLQAELQAGSGTIGVLGGLHGDFSTVGANLVDLSGVDIGGVKLNEAYKKLGMLGTGDQKYLPWMQATFLMAANKQALQYLPAGVDLNKITYDKLIEWSKNIAEKTGSPKFGFPAGPKGLKHRFFEGFLYPSYTGSMVTKFRSAEAETAWNKFKELWQYTNPNSTSYAFMQEPLLTGDVWVAFDHVARLADAFNQKPDEFVAFPAPAGPAGRGYMPVVAGVAIPKTGYGQGQGAGCLYAEAGNTDRDAQGHQLLPRGRRKSARRHAGLGESLRPGDRHHDRCAGCAAGIAADGARRSGRQVQPGLCRQFRAYRARWPGCAWRDRGTGDGAQGPHRPGQGTVLGTR
ncbi:ABC transporter substrate-binding protein [Mesorhizobium onobrychidis]|uniref:ABC transporter substrate-binding protein n=1 Tax=Mesorhizobium onobrychidis TaxID=2775404 RepID=UPI002157CD71|nr:ABC transporter substrate-binding protein [Mesorhizobium onobrychidis]